MIARSRTPLAAAALAAATLSGCSSGSSSGSPSASATAAAPAKSSAAPRTKPVAPPPKTEAPKTTGAVELHATKKKTSFSIVLPDAWKDVSDDAARKSYRKDKDAIDAYVFTISEAPVEFVKSGLDGTLAELQRDPDFVTNKGRIIERSELGTGWYFAYALEEPGGKKAVVVRLMARDGEVVLECHGEVEGPLAAKVDNSVKDMLDVCKTLAITAP